MLKVCEKLIRANNDIKDGNHRVEFFDGCRKFYYHRTAIIVTDENSKTFKTDNGGWNTLSTNRAIKSYRDLLTGKGYSEIAMA